MNDFMQLAIEQANNANGDIPVGAVIVKEGKVIAAACNSKEKDNDITSHAEILAIRKAENLLNNWRLYGCDMYVTLEPCPMCGWAIIQSRISNLYFGSYDANYGAFSTAVDLRKFSSGLSLNVYGGIKEQECDKILKDFFIKIR